MSVQMINHVVFQGSASTKVCPPGGHLGNGPRQVFLILNIRLLFH